MIDPSGVNLWAQWDGASDVIQVSVNMMNIFLEIDCLHPTLSNLITIVVEPETGKMVSLGMVQANEGGMSLENFQILYQE